MILNSKQLYSAFLLEKMDHVTLNGVEEQKEDPSRGRKRGRGGKREASQYDDVSSEHFTFSLNLGAVLWHLFT